MAKPRVETYEIEGHAVRLVNVPPCRREAEESSHMHGPAQKSKWEVYVDDVLRGFIFYPLGVGHGWVARSLRPQDLLRWQGEDGVRAWLPPTGEHGGWAETGGMWDGLLGLLEPLKVSQSPGLPYFTQVKPAKDRRVLAEAFVQAVKDRTAPNAAGVDKLIADARSDKIAREKEDAARKVRYAREAEERKVREAQEAARAEELRCETLMGLESILERYGADDNDKLGNLERVALCRAIETFGGKVDGA